MRREFHPSPLGEALPTLGWLLFFIIFFALGKWWLMVGILTPVFIFHAAFHRNPSRTPPEDRNLWVAPADGVVTDVMEVEESRFIKGKATRVGIFLSVLDVHTQPAPCDARLKLVDYQPGKFHDARDPQCSPENESQILGLESKDGIRLIVKQIAGKIARRIILWRLPEEEIQRGELLGMIRYGSRVEFYWPKGAAEPLVKPGERVQGGKTPVAKLR